MRHTATHKVLPIYTHTHLCLVCNMFVMHVSDMQRNTPHLIRTIEYVCLWEGMHMVGSQILCITAIMQTNSTIKKDVIPHMIVGSA